MYIYIPQQPPWPENECEAATSIPVTSEPARLPDMTSQELAAAAPLSSSEQPPPVRGGSVSGQSSLESQVMHAVCTFFVTLLVKKSCPFYITSVQEVMTHFI